MNYKQRLACMRARTLLSKVNELKCFMDENPNVDNGLRLVEWEQELLHYIMNVEAG
jgi:hypothetical protein